MQRSLNNEVKNIPIEQVDKYKNRLEKWSLLWHIPDVSNRWQLPLCVPTRAACKSQQLNHIIHMDFGISKLTQCGIKFIICQAFATCPLGVKQAAVTISWRSFQSTICRSGILHMRTFSSRDPLMKYLSSTGLNWMQVTGSK